MAEPSSGGLTARTLLSESRRLLEDHDYVVIRNQDVLQDLAGEHVLLAEDRFGVVAVFVYESWIDLATNWTEAQDSFVRVMTSRLGRGQPKAWDGYLVLLTPERPSTTSDEVVTRIRYDTSYVRKLVGTGEDIETLSDVTRVLLPLLPLEPEREQRIPEGEDILDSLVSRLAEGGLEAEAGAAVIDAFRGHDSMMEPLKQVLAGRPSHEA
jgi:hypothetical protein